MKFRSVLNVAAAIFPSAVLGASGVLLLAATLSTPTVGSIRVTRVTAPASENDYVLDLGILGACTNFPLSSYGGGGDFNCRDTEVGYGGSLSLPYYDEGEDEGGDNANASTTSRHTPVMQSGGSRNMVLVPVATAFEILGLIAYLVAAGVKNPIAGWVSLSLVGLSTVLSWASFAIVRQFTDTVRGYLGLYNDDPLAVMKPLVAERGNATWFILAAAAMLTAALLDMVYLQLLKIHVYKANKAVAADSSPLGKQLGSDEEFELS